MILPQALIKYILRQAAVAAAAVAAAVTAAEVFTAAVAEEAITAVAEVTDSDEKFMYTGFHRFNRNPDN